MGLQKTYIGKLTLGTGAAASSNVLAGRTLARSQGLVFYNDSAYTGTISLLVGAHADAVIGDLEAIENNGTAVTLTAGVVQKIDVAGFEALAIATDGTEGAERNVDVYALIDIGL